MQLGEKSLWDTENLLHCQHTWVKLLVGWPYKLLSIMSHLGERKGALLRITLEPLTKTGTVEGELGHVIDDTRKNCTAHTCSQ